MPTKTKPRATAPAPKKTLASPPAKGRRIQVKRSGVHGKGVFAARHISAGDDIMEYVGEVISWDEAQRRHPHDLCDPNHTFYFHIDGDHVIDALFGGNASRWINHSCEPNCESDERGGRIFILARHDIAAGTELTYDYGLVLEERYTAKLKAEYACHCGHANCRGTMLAPKRGIKLAAPAKPKTSQATVTKAAEKPKAKAKASADAAPARANAKVAKVPVKAGKAAQPKVAPAKPTGKAMNAKPAAKAAKAVQADLASATRKTAKVAKPVAQPAQATKAKATAKVAGVAVKAAEVAKATTKTSVPAKPAKAAKPVKAAKPAQSAPRTKAKSRA